MPHREGSDEVKGRRRETGGPFEPQRRKESGDFGARQGTVAVWRVGEPDVTLVEPENLAARCLSRGYFDQGWEVIPGQDAMGLILQDRLPHLKLSKTCASGEPAINLYTLHLNLSRHEHR